MPTRQFRELLTWPFPKIFLIWPKYIMLSSMTTSIN